MLDPQLFRQNLSETASRLATRGYVLPTAQLAELEERRKICQTLTQQLQSERNTQCKTIGKLKSTGGDTSDLMAQVTALGDELQTREAELEAIQAELAALVAGVPNVPHPSVPVGKSEADNREERRWGNPADLPAGRVATPQEHMELGNACGLLDADEAAKITGSRFVVLRGELARLHRALIQFMLDLHTREHGYTELYVPYMVNADSLYGTGQLPKFEEDLFKVTPMGYYLIPTAEVPVTNLVRDRIVDATSLPLKYVAHTPCFRSEAGSYGKDTRGMIRQHQFEKVELVQMVMPDQSESALEELTGHAEMVLRKLELPYRVVTLCTGDLGFSAAKTYDLEVWLPGSQKYREISSCSTFEAFQARRMLARYRDSASKKPMLLHTLNGSGVAVGRALVAVMENYQDEQGRIAIPSALQPYLGGLAHIGG